MKRFLDENGFYMLCMGTTAFAILCAAVGNYFDHQTTQAAIKAGLVQDTAGHWVQPMVAK